MKSNFIDILPELQAKGLDAHEAIATIQSVLSAGSSHKDNLDKRTYNLVNEDGVVGKAAYNKKNCLHKLLIPQHLQSKVLKEITSDLSSPETRVARTVMLTYRKLDASYTVPKWLQIRPVKTELQDLTLINALSRHNVAGLPFPFVIEVEYQSSNLIFLESHRRMTAVSHARWLLATFIDLPVFDLSTPYTWAFIEYKYCLVQCGIADGLEEESSTSFSDVSNMPKLKPVSVGQYYNSLGMGSNDFQVPDFAFLYSCFLTLTNANQQKFLGCCASIFSATNPSINWPQKLVLLVSAIEHLIENNEQCDKCKSSIGVAKAFQSFMREYVSPPSEVQDMYQAIYSNRSRITHGAWNPEVNEPFLSLHSIDESSGLSAWAAAKKGAITWLIAQAKPNVSASGAVITLLKA